MGKFIYLFDVGNGNLQFGNLLVCMYHVKIIDLNRKLVIDNDWYELPFNAYITYRFKLNNDIILIIIIIVIILVITMR